MEAKEFINTVKELYALYIDLQSNFAITKEVGEVNGDTVISLRFSTPDHKMKTVRVPARVMLEFLEDMLTRVDNMTINVKENYHNGTQ